MPSIATNVAANSALFYLNRNSIEQSNSLSKISSGSRIVRASDDAAGSAIAAGLSGDITSLQAAANTVQQTSALLQIADGGLQRVSEILQREKALATQGASGTISATERGFLNQELVALTAQIDIIANSTTYNGTELISGGFTPVTVVGVAVGDAITVNLNTVDVEGALGETVADAAGAAVTALDGDINTVSGFRATVGALQSQFDFQGEVVATQIENLQAAKASIADVDIAAEQTRFTNFQVLTEAAIAGLSQANQITQSLLSLLR